MRKEQFNFQEVAEKKRKEADRIETLEEIYIEIKNSMQWNIMSQMMNMMITGTLFQMKMITDTINTRFIRKF